MDPLGFEPSDMPFSTAQVIPLARASPDVSAPLSLAITVMSISRVISAEGLKLSADVPLKRPWPETNAIASADQDLSSTSENFVLMSAAFMTAPSGMFM